MKLRTMALCTTLLLGGGGLAARAGQSDGRDYRHEGRAEHDGDYVWAREKLPGQGHVYGAIQWGRYEGPSEAKDVVEDNDDRGGKAVVTRRALECASHTEGVYVEDAENTVSLALALRATQTTTFAVAATHPTELAGCRFTYVSRTRGEWRGGFAGGRVSLQLEGAFRAVDMKGDAHVGGMKYTSSKGFVSTIDRTSLDAKASGGVTNGTTGSVDADVKGAKVSAGGNREVKFDIVVSAGTSTETRTDWTAPMAFAPAPYVEESTDQLDIGVGQPAVVRQREIDYHWSFVYQVMVDQDTPIYEGRLEAMDFGTTTVRWVIDPYVTPPPAEEVPATPPGSKPVGSTGAVTPSPGSTSGTSSTGGSSWKSTGPSAVAMATLEKLLFDKSKPSPGSTAPAPVKKPPVAKKPSS